MPFLKALHLVLFSMLMISNLLMIPVIAMLGFIIGQHIAERMDLSPNGAAMISVVIAFITVGLINGLIGAIVLRTWPAPLSSKGKPSRQAKPEQPESTSTKAVPEAKTKNRAGSGTKKKKMVKKKTARKTATKTARDTAGKKAKAQTASPA